MLSISFASRMKLLAYLGMCLSYIGHLLMWERVISQLEVQLDRLNSELENVIWEKKEIMGQLNMANKERIMVEAMLVELEDEHDEAIAKIELLEGEVNLFINPTLFIMRDIHLFSMKMQIGSYVVMGSR